MLWGEIMGRIFWYRYLKMERRLDHPVSELGERAEEASELFHQQRQAFDAISLGTWKYRISYLIAYFLLQDECRLSSELPQTALAVLQLSCGPNSSYCVVYALRALATT